MSYYCNISNMLLLFVSALSENDEFRLDPELHFSTETIDAGMMSYVNLFKFTFG